MKKHIIFIFFLILSGSLYSKNGWSSSVLSVETMPSNEEIILSQKKKTARKKKPAKKQPPQTISGLRKQRSQVQRNIKEQERALRNNKADVKKRLGELLVLNSQIADRQKNIENVQTDISNIDQSIKIMQSQLTTLKNQLSDRQAKYIKSMRFMMRRHTIQDKLMFVFSADNFVQMLRRIRFIREYADYQRIQGENIKAKERQVYSKHAQLKNVRNDKRNLLSKGEKERNALQEEQGRHEEVVKGLQNQQKTIQKIIAEQRRKSSALNAQIDNLIAIEVRKARERAEAEAKRKAQAAALAKKKAAEAAARKAAAIAAERENARRVAEAKALEEKKRVEAQEAKAAVEKAQKEQQAEAERRAAAEKARADYAAKEAKARRIAAERKAEVDAVRNKQAIAEADKVAEESKNLSMVDRMMSGGFEANKGRLPAPITGKYRVVGRYGQHNVSGLRNVVLDNKGINLQGAPGCQARSVYDGEVSKIFSFGGMYVVMVRHGAYISVYCNLSGVSVSQGQKVRAGQVLGTVGTDNILQFQLHHEMTRLNPEAWLSR